MLKTRVIAALVFAPALLGIVIVGGRALAITCLVLALLMLWEFLQLTLGAGHLLRKGVGYLLTAALVSVTLGWLPQGYGEFLFVGGTLILLLTALVQPEPLSAAMLRVGLVGVGVAYCGGLIPFLARLRAVDGERGLGLALMALFCTWGADTGAYFAGRFAGKHKLYPTISPAKTIEGAVGGVVAAVAVAFFIRWLFSVPLPVVHTVVAGLIIGIFGAAGDLCESTLKRSVGEKDSSRLIPGHGGVLDRFDAVLFACPATYIYIAIALRP